MKYRIKLINRKYYLQRRLRQLNKEYIDQTRDHTCYNVTSVAVLVTEIESINRRISYLKGVLKRK